MASQADELRNRLCVCDVPSSDLKTVPKPHASVWVKLEPSSWMKRRGNQVPSGKKSGSGTLPSSAGMLSVTDPALHVAAEHKF